MFDVHQTNYHWRWHCHHRHPFQTSGVNPLSSVPYFCRGGWRGYLPLHEKYTCPCLQSLCVTLAFREVVLFPAQLTVRRNTKTVLVSVFSKGARWFSSNLEIENPNTITSQKLVISRIFKPTEGCGHSFCHQLSL